MRLGATKTGATTTYNGLGDQLYDNSGARPTLDLNFASNGSLVDSVTGKTLVTHTRASNATYVDGDGIIKDAVTNHIRNSEDLTATGWQRNYNGTGSAPVVTANAGVAPDGSQTAWKVDFDKGSGTTTDDRSDLSAGAVESTQNKRIYHSVYLKTTDGSTKSFRFDFNGATADVTGYNNSNITVTGEWQRFIIGYDSTLTFRSWVLRLRGSVTPDDQPTASVYLWHPQTEIFAINTGTPGEYIPNLSSADKNSAPRFDHNPTTGESLGLLVEESRTNLTEESSDFSTTWTTQFGASVSTVSGYTNPDGTSTVYKLTQATHSYAGLRDTHSFSAGDHTFSIYVRAVSGTAEFRLKMYDGTNDTFTGTLTATEEWQRFSVTKTCASGGGNYQIANLASSPNTDEMLIWGAQLEAGSFPTSYIRTKGSTVTRSADVTSIEGNDFGTFNLLQYSEEFDQSVWAKVAVSVTANQRTAPDGTLSMDTVTVTGGAGFLQQAITVVNSTVYTASTYVYADSDKTRIIIHNGTSDICNVSWTSISANTTTVSGTASNITSTDVGNGIYRLTFTFTSTSTTANYRIQPLDSSGNAVVGATGYFWGAQLEESSTATPYVKSDVTFTSRGSTATYYDYNGIIRTAAVDEARNVAFLPDGSGNFVSAGELLLEDAGTNEIKYSEQFDQVGSGEWTTISIAPFGSGSVANAITAPDGTLTADKISAVSGTNTPRYFQNTTGSGEWTFSVYAKAAEADCVFVSIYTGSTYKHLYYDLTNESVISATASSYSAVNVGNGWFRLSVTETTTSPYGNISFGLANATLANAGAYFLSDGTDGIYLWGAQLETGSYPTSYIPTYGSTATRAADVSSSSSNTFGNSFYNQTEMASLIELQETNRTGTRTPRSFSDGTANNRIDAFFTSSLTVRNRVVVAGVASNPGNLTLSAAGSVNKHLISAASGNAIAAVNGALSTASTPASLPIVDRLVIGADSTGATPFSGTIRRLTYWPTRLSNDTLKTITA